MSTWKPHGLGYFLSSKDTAVRPVKETVALLVEGGATWAMGWIEAPDGRHAKLERLVELTLACRGQGIEWGLWTMPRSSDVVGAVKRLGLACTTLPVHVSLNVERPTPKAREEGEPDWTVSTGAALFHGALDAIREPCSLSLSSYAVRSKWMHTIPFAALPCPVGMPELYKQADDAEVVAQSLVEWGAACPDGVVPIIDTFVGSPDRLERVLGRFGAVPLAVWDLDTTDKAERRVLNAHAALYGKP